MTQDFLQEYFRKHDALTLYKPDGTPVTICKRYKPVLIDEYRKIIFADCDRLEGFCRRNRINLEQTVIIT